MVAGYVRLLGRLFLGFVAILFLFALAPGDTSFLAAIWLMLFAGAAGRSAWLRAPRPQDAKLARIARVVEARTDARGVVSAGAGGKASCPAL